jgi:hypothetical protein
MEDIITKYIENKHNFIIENNKKILEENKKLLDKTNNILQLKDQENNKILQLKDEENNKLLQLKDQEMENNKKLLDDTLIKLQLKDLEIESFKNRKYEEIEKDKHVYIFSCNLIKVSSNDYLLELIVHYVLDSYRCKSNGEHFTANLEYTKIVIDLAEVFLDTLKSTYEHITKEELIQKINENIENQLIEKIKNIELNITPIIEISNKPIKKLNKKIIPKNIKSEILGLRPPIIEPEDNIIELDDIELPCSSEPIFNYDNDIIDWFKLNYELTNNKEDIIKLKDIYDVFSKSIQYRSMKKKERLKYNKSYLVEFVETNSFFSNYYCNRSENMRTFIKCWKLKIL